MLVKGVIGRQSECAILGTQTGKYRMAIGLRPHALKYFINTDKTKWFYRIYHSAVIMSAIASQITSVSVVCSTVCSCADQRKHQRPASLTFGLNIFISPQLGKSNTSIYPLLWGLQQITHTHNSIHKKAIMITIMSQLQSKQFALRSK